jgi:hypothetical protein
MYSSFMSDEANSDVCIICICMHSSVYKENSQKFIYYANIHRLLSKVAFTV